MNQLEDVFKRKIRFTEERRKHIEGDHPEMSGQEKRIVECLLSPEQVRQSRTDERVELFVIAKIRSYTPFQLITKTVSCRDTYS
ncbi:hypothetical protein Lepto782_05160 [Leptospira interrogans serovar Canicola]|uniref:Uncharacterized protein n=1 Tax=Leptospira interrogans serovar Canicola TaxID=211880 RepID=A0AAP9W9G7_LEPIR|nr:hypothetical protein Lepto782_05040 [Leptospira interrogans serovar Canicola]QOI41719.1 hypothetical protein Lepto782_05160 [Leptospira interrogans serovar Canicola]